MYVYSVNFYLSFEISCIFLLIFQLHVYCPMALLYFILSMKSTVIRHAVPPVREQWKILNELGCVTAMRLE